MKNRNLSLALLISGTCLLMGIAMPSCPGQQAMQQQVDALQSKSTEQTQRIQALDGQIKRMAEDMNQMKQLAQEMGKSMMEQRTQLATMDATIKAMAAKPAPKAPARGRRH